MRAGGGEVNVVLAIGDSVGGAIVAGRSRDGHSKRCGGLAGLAGSGEILGLTGFMPAGYSTNVGFDAITVALLGQAHPVGILFSGLLLGAMRAGAGLMQIEASAAQAILRQSVAPMLHRFEPRSGRLTKHARRRINMLETIAIILIVLWLLGLVSGYTMGNFIYVLLVIAIVLFLVRLISGRRVV